MKEQQNIIDPFNNNAKHLKFHKTVANKLNEIFEEKKIRRTDTHTHTYTLM